MRGTWQTTGSSGPSWGLIAAVIAVLIVAGSGAASAIASALVTILIIACSLVGLAVIGGIALLVWRVRSERPGQAIAARPVYQLPPEPAPQLSEPSRTAAIEQAPNELHLHFRGVPDERAAEIICRALPGQARYAITDGINHQRNRGRDG